MRTTHTILGLIHERGTKGLPLERVQRLLYNSDLYLTAYGKLYRVRREKLGQELFCMDQGGRDKTCCPINSILRGSAVR